MKSKVTAVFALLLCLGALATGATPAEPDISETCLRNHDFAFGTDFWSAYLYNAKPENALIWEKPAVMSEDDAGKRRHFLRIGAGSCLRTMMTRITPGQVYTVTVIARSAVKDKKAEVRCFLIDGAWHIKGANATLGGGWEKITFQQTFPFSKQARAYCRVDAQEAPVDVASVYVVKGEAPEALLKPMDVRLGFVGNRCFSAEEPGNALNLKAIVSEQAKLPLEVTVVSRDLWGKVVWNKKIVIDQTGESVVPIAIANAPKGTFVCEAAGGGAKGDCRYAVLPPTAGKELPFHAACGHFPLFQYPDRAPFDRYMTFATNRFFTNLNMESDQPLTSETFREVIKRSGYQNIVNLAPQKMPKLAKMLKEKTDMTDEERNDLEEYLRQVLPPLASAGIYGVELFNEPYLWRFGPKHESVFPPEKLAALHKIAFPIFRELAPNVKIVAQTTVGGEYFERFVKAGGPLHCDVVAIHPYGPRPDFTEIYQNVTMMREKLRQATGREIPVISTEQYVGTRDTPVYNHDTEYFREYIMDNEWECAKVTAENLAHHAAAGIPEIFFAPDYVIDGFGPEAAVYHPLGVVNAATHVYANAGKGTILNNVPESIRAFYFPDAKPQPFAVLYSLPMATEGRVLFQDPVRVLDVMGNEMKLGAEGLPLTMPFYVYFPNGGGEKTLENALWLNLGNPVKVSIVSDDRIDVQVSNMSLQPEPLTLEMKNYPGAWRWKTASIEATLAPREKKTFAFELEKGKFQHMKRYDLGLKIQRQGAFVTKPVSFAAVFVPYQKDLDLQDSMWNEVKNPSPAYSLAEGMAHAGPEDLSARFAAVWNETGLKLAVRVKDDMVFLADNRLQSYNNDSLQLYFDMKHDGPDGAETGKKNAKDDVDWLVYSDGKDGFAYLIHNETGRYVGENNATSGLDGEVKVNFRKLPEKETDYEIFFPASVLPQMQFRPGACFGFSLLVNDNDGKGRKAGLTLAPAGTEPNNHPELFLDMVLQAPPPQKAPGNL